jgi:hypothetical protein
MDLKMGVTENGLSHISNEEYKLKSWDSRESGYTRDGTRGPFH